MDERSRLRIQAQFGDDRSHERVIAHYRVEKELADHLRGATREQRRTLYASVYDELFRRVLDHPQVKQKSATKSRSEVLFLRKLLGRYVRPNHIFLEIGSGDCALTSEIARLVTKAYAVEVSAEIVKGIALPRNVELLLSDGCNVPGPRNGVDVAFSNQVMEHLHPDDALEQLRDIYDILKPGGVYVCMTPNRLSGPHDISVFFDETATGFHLMEYTLGELATLFRQVGFRRLTVLIGTRGIYLALPVRFVGLVERLVALLPKRYGMLVSRTSVSKFFLGIKLVGRK